MKITLVFTGKTNDEYLKKGISLYIDRLKHYLPLEILELNPPKYPSGMDSSQIRVKESDWLLDHLPACDYLVILDEGGTQLTSASFSDFIQGRMNRGIKNMIFLIGGAYGISDLLKKKADFILSLSALTFTHQMTRLILAEQIYRAMTILKREPYHNP
jgi:23S rRNA (pseudouridine1915-N3)-methyltransferase